MTFHQSHSCACCGDLLRGQFSRRRFLQVGVSTALVSALPFGAFAATGSYEAMLLSCIDPRFPEHTLNYTKSHDLSGKYSQFAFAGAAIGAVAPKFKGWHTTFWDNLGASIQLHQIKKVIAMNHRDCGAAKIAYGAAKVATPEAETKIHREALAQFRRRVGKRFPKLGVETGLMALDGSVEMFAA
jgi:carbonic anhydrase